jgi:hypothetical protein
VDLGCGFMFGHDSVHETKEFDGSSSVKALAGYFAGEDV